MGNFTKSGYTGQKLVAHFRSIATHIGNTTNSNIKVKCTLRMKAIKLNDESGPLKLVSVPVNYPPPSGGGLLDRDVCLLYFHLSKCSLINAKVLQADVDYKNYYQLQRRPVSELLQLHKCSTKSSKKVMKVFRCCTTHLPTYRPTYLPTDPPTNLPIDLPLQFFKKNIHASFLRLGTLTNILWMLSLSFLYAENLLTQRA